ncbi:hypothetical protein CAPTEDRAFT_89737 [Capitella teleta]|uniref:Guanylate cyclase n=1 Tax=Capitella teleta TaxID=283909 RepID=R7TKD3_CAPTE|nr:hypothetical protein CAPTEDRAFT_89737 [Capitella teleta]|eukprot:ELT93947.1 hypothetical protein CAPTEDRAFT_89737 [Capitella teleta]
MREMTHENVNQFLGACPSAQNVCVCFLFCPKGSLDDLLANDEINLDKDFKTSLISDLISGMTYLHGSAVGCHGNLKSSTCLVDSRWVLKISMFGTRPFYVNDDHYEGDYARFKAQLWTSPELLRSASTRRDMLGGTQKGDVYSFAIILQEILFRSPPFFFDGFNLCIVDIIKRVKVGESPPFRPQLPSEGRGSFGQIAELMEHCWNEDPNVRPSFKKIKKMVKRSAGKNANLVDRMIQRLEKYATNLEDLVQARTAELESEKRKTDRLLYRMLPPSIAEGLKQGNSIEPEMFQSVTIYFSDIVHFTSLCSESSAVQVVTLLSDLYSLFDAIIANYDVYKVETIGDAYMVASGLPERNGNRHVAQIADMSLALLDAVIHKFTVRHMPGRRLKLRIGVHTGPCAAGVVGLTMPRYCLFGDTVNTASRMESNGEGKLDRDISSYFPRTFCRTQNSSQRGGERGLSQTWELLDLTPGQDSHQGVQPQPLPRSIMCVSISGQRRSHYVLAQLQAVNRH